LDLLPTDILKATLIGESPEQRRDALSESWEELEEETGRQGFVDLFGHIRMIYARSKARASLLDEFRTHVRPQAQTAELIITQIIQPHADAYLAAKRCSYKATSHAAEVNAYLAWLNRIDFSDWLPVAIRFIVKHENEPAYMDWFFQRLERLAAFLHVCARSINDRIERFATVLADLERPSSLDNPVTTVELSEAEKAEMRVVLDGDVYLLTARRRNYIILRLDSFVSDGAASYSPDTLTIEHVLPQSVDAGSEWDTTWPEAEVRTQWMHRIGNLVPLTQRKNSMAQNYPFGQKKKIYFARRGGVASYALTSDVLNTSEWTPASLAQRQSGLQQVFVDRWRLEATAAV
jgi:hypothetical protein